MKIGKTPGSVGGAGTPASAGSTAAPGTPRAGSVGTGANTAPLKEATSATVTLSPAVAQLHSALALAGSGEVYDAKQVASIKQAISDGQFKVNPEKVADKLIQSVQEMLAARTARQGT